jgi:hypothetical protein
VAVEAERNAKVKARGDRELVVRDFDPRSSAEIMVWPVFRLGANALVCAF